MATYTSARPLEAAAETIYTVFWGLWDTPEELPSAAPAFKEIGASLLPPAFSFDCGGSPPDSWLLDISGNRAGVADTRAGAGAPVVEEDMSSRSTPFSPSMSFGPISPRSKYRKRLPLFSDAVSLLPRVNLEVDFEAAVLGGRLGHKPSVGRNALNTRRNPRLTMYTWSAREPSLQRTWLSSSVMVVKRVSNVLSSSSTRVENTGLHFRNPWIIRKRG